MAELLDFSAFDELVVLAKDFRKYQAGSPAATAPVSENPDRQFYQSGTTEENRTFDPAVYSVKSGDTLSRIAARNPFTLQQLKEANQGIDFDDISIGQELKLPDYKTQSPSEPSDAVVPKPSEVSVEELVEEVSAELPSDIAAEVSGSGAETSQDVNVKIFDATSFSGSIPTPEKGADPIRWIAENAYGLNENDPVFREAMKAVTNVDPKKTAWCASFAAHVLKGIGVPLPDLARQNPAMAFNYLELGEEVYNHNPTTGRTYAGSLDSVEVGDVVVFNNGGRFTDGRFKWGQGHISFVVGKEEDGSILALGGNQGGGTKVTTTRYTPEIVKKHFKAGFTVRRINDGSLENTDPSVIAAVTKDISVGGAER